MNCKPNDLARIIDSPGTHRVGCVDRIIRVTRSTWHPVHGTSWEYEAPLVRCKCGCGFSVSSFADEVLRPIGNPGPEAVDETLVHNPAPVREEQPA